MLIELTTDKSIQSGDNLREMVQAAVEGSLARYGEQITRVAVHLQDANSHKKGEGDKHCTMEARVAGYQPVAVSNDASSLDDAVDGCTDKLVAALEHRLGKLSDHKGRTPMSGEVE